MGTHTRGLLALGLLLGAWAGAPVATANSGQGGDFSLTGRFTDYRRADRGQPGWGEGDEISFRFDLFDHRAQAGDGDGLCTITRYDRQTGGYTTECTSVFNLDTGTLDLAGEITDEAFGSREIVLDVVGGSERFKGAKGIATFTRAGPSRHRDFRVDVDLA